MTDWQPIETAPRDGTEIFVYTSVNGINGFAVARYQHELWQTGIEIYYDDNIVGWQPLPKPPLPKKKHYCESFLSNWVCTDDRELPGLILVNHTGKIKVDYCPFCGEAANPTKDEPTMPFGMYASKKIAQLPNYYIDLLF